MKRLNLKLVIFLVVGASTLVAFIYFAHAYQTGSVSNASKQEAEELAKDGKREQALKKYMTYLHENDEDKEAHLAFAKLAFDYAQDNPSNASFTTAYQALNGALRHNPDEPQLHEDYAKMMMIINPPRFEDAREHLQWLTDPARGEHDPKFDVMLIVCYKRLSFNQRAVDLAGSLIGMDDKTHDFDVKKAKAPKSIEAYVILASMYREIPDLRQNELADAVMNQLVKANPNNFKAHLERAKYLLVYHSPQSAKEDVAAATKLAPDDADVILTAAASATAEKKYDDAEKLLRRGLEKYPKNVGMYRQWAVLKIDQNQVDEALKQLQAGLKLQPREASLLWILTELQVQKKDHAAARITLKTLTDLNYNKGLIDLMEARILFLEGKWLAAGQKFEELRPLLAQMPEQIKQADLYAAQCYEQLGAVDKQLEACRRVLSLDPNNLAGTVGVASALMAQSKKQEAEKYYIKAVQMLGPKAALNTPQVWVPLVEIWLEQQSKLPKEERDWTVIDNFVNRLEKSSEGSDAKNAPGAVVLVKAEVQFRKGDAAAAQKTLENGVKQLPDDPAMYSALATILVQQKTAGPAAALKVLDSAPEKIRDVVSLRLNRAGILLRQGADNIKQQIDQLDKGSDKLSPADRAKLWAGLGTAVLAIGDREDAEKYFGRVADANPDDVRVRFGLLEIARDTGDDAVMTRVQNDIGRIMGKESAEARFVDAARTVALVRKSIKDRTIAGHLPPPADAAQKQSLGAARKLLEQVSQVRPGWHEVSRVEGDLELLDGNVDNAIAHYQQALKNGPPNPVTIRALVVLLGQRRRTEELDELLSTISTSQAEQLGVVQALVQRKADEKNFDEAIKMAEREVAPTSADPYGQMWIANLYEKGKQPDKAEARFRRAVETGSELPETWLMLIDHLVNNKKADEASKVLDEARKKLPEDRVNQVLGPGFEAMGRTVEAEEYYKAAVLAQPDDLALHRLIAMFYLRQQRFDDARREVDTILRDAPKDLAKNLANLLWARRAKADLLAKTGKFEDFLRAKELLLENARLNEDDTEDKLRLATLLASRSDEPSSWREAVQWLDKIKQLPDAQKMTLARLHDVLGEWGLARREMLQLVTQRADKQAYALFVEMLIRHNEVVDAADWLEKLDKVQPGAGLLLRARVLVRQGRPHDAVALLRRIVPPKPVPQDKVGFLRTVAFLMDQLGLDDAAEEMYRDYMSYNAGEGGLHLAAFLGRHGRLDEALDLCEQAIKTQPVPTVAQIACVALRSEPTRVTPEHAARVQKWFDRLLKEDPDSVPLLLQYADFFDITGRDAEAEKHYRELLARKDLKFAERAMALNNLAFTLAMQKKNLPEALEFANQSMQLLGQTSDLLDTRGMVYVSMENFAAAANDFSEAVLVQEPSPLKLLHLAYAQDMAGDRLGARQTLQRAKDNKLDTNALTKIERDFYEKIVHDVGP